MGYVLGDNIQGITWRRNELCDSWMPFENSFFEADMQMELNIM